MTHEEESRMVLYALRLGWDLAKRRGRITKAREAEIIAKTPDFTFRAKPVPGWVYFPATDTVQRAS